MEFCAVGWRKWIMSPVVQSQGLFKSITYALRSRANVT